MPIQTGALPWRVAGRKEPMVLLVTGRRSGRWMIPKGWPIVRKSLATSAAQEAFEEAGVKGQIEAEPLGSFGHVKTHLPVGEVEVSIVVYPLEVEQELPDWPEAGQRRRKWFTLEDAARQVESKELGALILKLKDRLPGPSGA